MTSDYPRTPSGIKTICNIIQLQTFTFALIRTLNNSSLAWYIWVKSNKVQLVAHGEGFLRWELEWSFVIYLIFYCTRRTSNIESVSNRIGPLAFEISDGNQCGETLATSRVPVLIWACNNTPRVFVARRKSHKEILRRFLWDYEFKMNLRWISHYEICDVQQNLLSRFCRPCTLSLKTYFATLGSRFVISSKIRCFTDGLKGLR